MKRKKAQILAICGAVIAVLSGLLIAYGIFEAVERSQYQNIGMNTPVVRITALACIAGAAMLVIGLQKMRPPK